MKRRFLLIGTLCALLAIVFTVNFAMANQDKTPQTEQDISEIALDGVVLEKPSVEAVISEKQAEEIASNFYPTYASTAKNIKVEYQLMTNPNFKMFSESALEKNQSLKENGYLKDAPVYIVTFKGINKVGHNGHGIKSPTVFKEYNAVVDAISGEVLYGFSYR